MAGVGSCPPAKKGPTGHKTLLEVTGSGEGPDWKGAQGEPLGVPKRGD